VDIVYYMVKLLFPYALSCVFSGVGRPWGMAMIGLQIVLYIVKVLSFTTDPEVARFWIPIFCIWVYLGLGAMMLTTCVDIGYYLYGLYALKFDPASTSRDDMC
jgi:tryptophan-rich sensory protein